MFVESDFTELIETQYESYFKRIMQIALQRFRDFMNDNNRYSISFSTLCRHRRHTLSILPYREELADRVLYSGVRTEWRGQGGIRGTVTEETGVKDEYKGAEVDMVDKMFEQEEAKD